MNKQLSMLNYKLQNNMKDIGRDFYNKDEDDIVVDLHSGGVKRNVFYPGSQQRGVLNIDNDTSEQIFERKKAIAELEKEQEDIKGNIKSLMRRAPESMVIDDPLYAERVKHKDFMNDPEKESLYKVP
jgi:hypothetical protein